MEHELCVVFSGKVVRDCETFCDDVFSCIVVDDDGDLAGGVERCVPGGFLLVGEDVDGLGGVMDGVGAGEFFKEDGDFET
jgi:hypothetical protein